MRVTKPSFSPKFKPGPEIRHDSRVLTGFGGISVFCAYLTATGLVAGLRSRLKKVRKLGDYAAFPLVYLLLLFVAVGGRRATPPIPQTPTTTIFSISVLPRTPGTGEVMRFSLPGRGSEDPTMLLTDWYKWVRSFD